MLLLCLLELAFGQFFLNHMCACVGVHVCVLRNTTQSETCVLIETDVGAYWPSNQSVLGMLDLNKSDVISCVFCLH